MHRSLLLLFAFACADQVEPLDGGLDARPDATGMDSGSDLDASPEDASPQDASPEDASPPDASPQDASPEDASPEDASPEDASTVCPFGIDDTVTAVLRVSADDDRRVHVNEVLVDDLQPARTWQTPTVVNVPLFRHPARANVVAALTENYYRIDGLDRGLLLDITTSTSALITDSSWRVSTATAAGYETAAFDDSAWVPAVQEVMHPGGVYGALFGVSSAWWIWLYDAAIPAAMKPITETMAARRIFYIHADGTFADTPGSCP